LLEKLPVLKTLPRGLLALNDRETRCYQKVKSADSTFGNASENRRSIK
jgi:hypothetical protein